MNLEELAGGMLSPPKEEADLLISSIIMLPVTLTAQINYRRAGDDAYKILMRFSTAAGETIWAEGKWPTFIYRHPCETLDLQVHVSNEGLQAVGSYFLDEPNGLIWLDLRPVPEEIIDGLPGEVANEIRLNQAGKFAGAPHDDA